MNKIIDIGKDYCMTPAGRHRLDGEYSGQRFLEEYLLPLLRENQHLTIVLDSARGYGSSFLEEAFGGLIRHGHYTESEVHSKITLVANKSSHIRFIGIINKYLREEQERQDRA